MIDHLKDFSVSIFSDLWFGILFSLFMGLIFGPLSICIEYSLIFLVLYEIFIFAISSDYGHEKISYRILLNIFYLIGWIWGRWLYLNSTGIEHFICW
uniref:Uncharacterized protein n=1 Tax=viral metagenome TaxID=1070528 RepID=A0A6C0AEB7_9ZZZZ